MGSWVFFFVGNVSLAHSKKGGKFGRNLTFFFAHKANKKSTSSRLNKERKELEKKKRKEEV